MELQIQKISLHGTEVSFFPLDNWGCGLPTFRRILETRKTERNSLKQDILDCASLRGIAEDCVTPNTGR